MTTERTIGAIVVTTLQLGEQAAPLTRSSRLLGAIPEFDSMAVVTIIAALEEHYGLMFDDDELDAGSFETIGSLCDLVDGKLAG